MIDFVDLNDSEPYKKYVEYYLYAKENDQNNIEAASIASFNSNKKEVNSRFVNIKYILEDEWIFFSNYNSAKSDDFKSHSQISILHYWNNVNLQIRLKAKIFKTSVDISDRHFKNRAIDKNILSSISNQSKKIDSYKAFTGKYEKALRNSANIIKRPDYWGGYSFKPYYFEFWKGQKSRVNERNVYEMRNGSWEHYVLEP